MLAAELEKAGLRKSVSVIIGGAPLSQEYADSIGADGFGADGGAAIAVATELAVHARSTG